MPKNYIGVFYYDIFVIVTILCIHIQLYCIKIHLVYIYIFCLSYRTTPDYTPFVFIVSNSIISLLYTIPMFYFILCYLIPSLYFYTIIMFLLYQIIILYIFCIPFILYHIVFYYIIYYNTNYIAYHIVYHIV